MIVGAFLFTVALIYAIAYLFYGRKLLQERVVRADPSRPTPAHTKYDGIDYVPANKYVLYGHHFASIAGAGPIVGPALAMAYGWALPFAWVLFGNVFIGAVHDYLALMASVRHGGISIMSVSESVMGRAARYIFLLYVYFALILVLAAFISVAARLYTGLPHAATKALAYMPIAILLGFMLYRIGLSQKVATPIALILIVVMLAYSYFFPFNIAPIPGIGTVYHTWVILLALYAIVAASLPVWYLLQPRDYLNAYLLWSFVAVAALSALLAAPLAVTGPAYTSWAPKIIAGTDTPFWPAIVLLIACGSLSGFHSVVASGTSSKQLASELDALLVGYGGMLTEGAVSSLAVITPMALAWQAADFPQLLEAMGKADLIPKYQEQGILALGRIDRFTYSYGYIAGKAFGLGVFNVAIGKFFVIFSGIALATFILTTLDTATRLGRFVWQEMFDWLEPRSRALYRVLTNRWVASIIIVLFGAALAYPYIVIGGKKLPAFVAVWPAFAGTNQLLAALALLTSALWVYLVLRARGAVNLLIQIPALFLWVTVTVALAWWLGFVAPKLPAVQAYGAGSLVAISLVINIMLITLYARAVLAGPQPTKQAT
jgi:carbon starvation protein